jgi:hypothetical protein
MTHLAYPQENAIALLGKQQGIAKRPPFLSKDEKEMAPIDRYGRHEKR